MSGKNAEANRIELLQGTLDMLILRTLQWGAQHGHGIGQAIRQTSADLLQIERGSLYPALHRLEARGLISSEWRNQPESQILPADQHRQKRTCGRGIEMEADGPRHLPGNAAGEGDVETRALALQTIETA
jgi:hypothetical protein